MKLYKNDYLLQKRNRQFLKWNNGNFIIYEHDFRQDEIVYEGEKWVRVTELPKKIKDQLIKQIKRGIKWNK